MLAEMTSQVAAKLLQLYEAGIISRSVLDDHMSLKIAFLRHILFNYDDAESDAIEDVLDRYENSRRPETINNLLT